MQSDDFKKLLYGYNAFFYHHFRKDTDLYRSLKGGQKPKHLIVSCSDSRVDPALILSVDPGEIFVIRNVANIIPPYCDDHSTYHGVTAAVEFGVSYLNVENVIIIGHSGCAGIAKLVDMDDSSNESSILDDWIKIMKPAKDDVVENYNHLEHNDIVTECSKKAVLISCQNLLTFPQVKKKYEQKELTIKPWFFDVKTGILSEYDFKKNCYRSVKELYEF